MTAALNALFAADLAPSITNINVRPIVDTALSGNTVQYQAAWKANDSDGIVNTYVWMRTNGGAWFARTIPTPTTHTFTFLATYGSKYQVAVQAEDALGNWSNINYSRVEVPSLMQQNNSAVHYSTGWSASTLSAASGGSIETTHTLNASASVSANTAGIAIVATPGPNRGFAKVYIDNVYVRTINLFASTSEAQRVVFSQSWAASGHHTVTYINASTKAAQPVIDVDAFSFTN